MRGVLAAFLGICATVCGFGCATSTHATKAQRGAQITPRVTAPPAPSRDALKLAELLPADADRCVIVDPTRLNESSWLGAALLSQASEMPWGLSLPVLGYARAELTPRGDRKRVIELVRFGDVSEAEIRAQIEAQGHGDISWGERAPACEDAFTCVPVRARFLDARTVQLSVGDWPYGATHVGSPCAALLAKAPDAFEVSARRSTSGLGPTRVTQAVLRASERGIQRVVERAFDDESAAERALLSLRTGNEGFSTLSGMPVDEEVHRDGHLLTQKTRISWEELTLVLEDQARLRALEGRARDEANAEAPDLDDADVVRGYADRQIARLKEITFDERKASAAALSGLLERALRVHPKDEGLARRLYHLKLSELSDPAGALAVVDTMLGQGVSDVPGFQLARRAALAHVDEVQLRKELARVHHLPLNRAMRMAATLHHAVTRGEDYEQAEWAFLTADMIDQRAERTKLVDVPHATVEPALFIRALAVLARAGGLPGPFGVHVLAHGAVRDGRDARPGVLWSQRIDVGRGQSLVLAATSSTELELVSLGRALREQLADGPVEIGISLVPLTSLEPSHGPLVRLSGELSAQGLLIERGSAALRMDFDKLLRVLVTPLSRLSGAAFPPDDLIVDASSSSEAHQLAAAASAERGARCSVDGLTVSCRGPLDDAHAALDMLVAMTRVSFAAEASALVTPLD